MTSHDRQHLPPAASYRRLVACSLWLHLGLIGAATLAVGLLQWFDGQAPRALGLAFFGSMLAAASWRRGLAVLESIRHAPDVVTGAPNEPSLRAPFVATARGTAAMLSAIPLGSNRRGR